MTTATIEELAYLLKQAKEKGLPQPIVFLGAGASKTGGVPLAGEIVNHILDKYKENPRVRVLDDSCKSYKKLMECLTPYERKELLNNYINKAKINVTHIYLAQLLIEGYVDYVLTVNFDNLMLRALALFNFFPATYDLSNLKDLTTSSFKEKSVVYLHGQHHGLWLLNTDEEMAKVNEIVPPTLNSIKNQRPWIFIGYSGEDPIFEHIKKLGRFDNGLYWVTYHDSNPNETICNELLEKANTNSFLVKGFDADSFMVKLNAELNLPQPIIIDKPFTSLKQTLENIVDIDDKEHFKGVKERLEIVKKDVSLAIEQFEKGNINSNENLQQDLDISKLKKQIIDKIVNQEFNENEVHELEKVTAALNNKEINALMSNLFNNWGNALFNSSKSKKDQTILTQSFEKFQKAMNLNPNNVSIYYNWGNALTELAKIEKSKVLFEQSITKFEKAIELDPNDSAYYNNLGTAIYYLANLTRDVSLHRKCIPLYEKSIKLNPAESNAYNNWGNSLVEIAKIENNDKILKDSLTKFEKSVELNPNNALAYNNWGNAISRIGKKENNVNYYIQSLEKYKKANELDSKNSAVLYNWGTALYYYAKIENNPLLFEQSLEKLTKSVELGGSSYNLACYYAATNDKLNALKNLDISIKKRDVALETILLDDDWSNLKTDADFISIIQKYSSNNQ